MTRDYKANDIPNGMHKVTKLGCVFGTGDFVNLLWEYGTSGAGSSKYTSSQVAIMIDMWNQGWEVAYDDKLEEFWFLPKIS